MGGVLAMAGWLLGPALMTMGCALAQTQPQSGEFAGELAQKMAQYVYKESGFAALVRRNDQMADCGASNAKNGDTFISQSQLVTEFFYSHKLICVAIYAPADQDMGNRDRPLLNPGSVEAMFGSLDGVQYREWQRLGFRSLK